MTWAFIQSLVFISCFFLGIGASKLARKWELTTTQRTLFLLSVLMGTILILEILERYLKGK